MEAVIRTQRRATLIAMVAAATMVASCSHEDSLESASDTKIYGGTAVEGNRWSSAVAIVSNSLCTGTVVAPTLVISAAHCFTRQSSPSALRVVVGNRSNQGTSYRVSKFAISPNYKDTPFVNPSVAAQTDIAYLTLAEPIRDVDIIPVLTDPEEIKVLLSPGAQSVLVGFGATERGTLGVKHETTTTVKSDQGGALFIGGGGKDSCQGDSGGPAYGQLPNGEWRVYGITSRGSGCGQGGLLARMHDGLCWIQEDSGVIVPGSKLSCRNLPNDPNNVGNLTQSLSLMLMDDSQNDQSYLAIGGSPTIRRVAVCFGDRATCAANKKEDLAFSLAAKSTNDRRFFKSQRPLTLRQGLAVTLLGFDASGQLLAATGVRIERQ